MNPAQYDSLDNYRILQSKTVDCDYVPSIIHLFFPVHLS